MPLYIFQTSGNPVVRVLISLAILAGFIGLAIFVLPAVLTLVGIAMLLGLVAWLWNSYQRKKYGEPFDPFMETLKEAQAEAESRRRAEKEQTYQESYSGTIVRVETTDKKKWKMDDVEDIEVK